MTSSALVRVRRKGRALYDRVTKLMGRRAPLTQSLGGTLRERASSSYRELALRRLPHRTRSPLAEKPQEFRNARVLSPDWHVIVPGEGVRLNDEVSHKKWLVNRASPTLAHVGYPHKTYRVTEPCILLGGHYNYYHHLIDYTFNLFYMERAWQGDWMPLLMLQPEAAFQTQILDFLGIPESRTIPVPNLCAVKCARLTTIPRSFRKFGTALDVQVFDWIRDRFTSRFDGGRSRRLFISRRLSDRRRIVNEEELTALLAPRGFETVVLENLSFAQQVELFAAADAIVGAHGAGLTNLVFSRRGTAVCELAPADLEPTRKFYENLAVGGGMKHMRVDGSPSLAANRDFTVDADKLRSALDGLGVA